MYIYTFNQRGKSHVIKMIGCVEYKGHVSVIMPFFESVSIRDIVSSMKVQNVQFYFKSLFKALKHIHSHNVIHRDIKPGNILYDPLLNSFSVIDFGLAHYVCIIFNIKFLLIRKLGNV